MLQNSGPVGIWLWPVVAVGQTLIALVIAQFAARIPLSGSSYQWASRLANPKIGWFFGWLSFCYLVIGVVAVDNALANTALMPLLGMAEDQTTARVITVVMLLAQAVLVIASTRIVGVITSAAVGLELIIVVVLVVALFIAVAVTGDGSASNLTSRGVAGGASDYFAIGGGLMAAMIMGIATLVGFDAAANMAEEAKDPLPQRPRAIRGIRCRSRGFGPGVRDRTHRRDQGHPPHHRHQLAGRTDPARSTRCRDGTLTARRDRDRLLRCRAGDAGDLCPHGLRYGARRPLPRPEADAKGQPAHAHPDPGDHPHRVLGIALMAAVPVTLCSNC